MKVLLLRSLNPFFETGASANRYSGIIKGLLKNNANVTLVVTGGYNNLDEYKSKGRFIDDINLQVRYTIFTFNNNIWLRRINLFLLNNIFRTINTLQLKHYFNDKYDYIWLTNNIDILSAFNRYSVLVKSKTIIELNEFNDIYKGVDATGNQLQMRHAIFADNVFKQSVLNIDLFAVMTKSLIEYYSKMAKPDAKFFHFPMTVDLSRFSEIPKTDKYKMPYIAFTGTFNNTKDGVDILIQSFYKIANKYEDLHLYLAGFYHYDVQEQKKMISHLKLNNRISYLGVLNKEQIPELVCNASVLVLPRPDSHQAQGGFPTKLGEYLATGNPVCVTKVGEIPDYLEDNFSAFMASPGDSESFADAMDRALSDRENARRVGNNGLKVALDNFSIDVQVKRLVKFLEDNL